MSTPIDLLGTRLAEIATALSTSALAADPQLKGRLNNLQGQSIELQCTLPPATWHLLFTPAGLKIEPGPAPAPQAIVQGSALDLASWLLPGRRGHVEISGDTTLLAELAEIFRQFNPDMAKPLASVFGEDLAATWVGTTELGIKGLRALIEGLGQSVQHQAGRTFMQNSDMEAFLRNIDALRLRVDRLAARIDQQEQNRRQATF